MVYDVTKWDTFLHVKKWLDELKDHAEPDIVIILVGNKIDLVEANEGSREVSTEEAQEFSDKHKLKFQESSAVEDINVKSIFEELLTEIYDVKSKSHFSQEWYEEKRKRLVYSQTKPKEKEEGGCCP